MDVYCWLSSGSAPELRNSDPDRAEGRAAAKSGDTKSDPKRKALLAPLPPEADGENGLLQLNKSSAKKVFIDVGDSLSDDGGDGESAVDPPGSVCWNLPPPPPPPPPQDPRPCLAQAAAQLRMLSMLLLWMRASSLLWIKWQRGPYGQNPVVWKVRHNSVLYFGWRTKLRSSCIPCANWHLSPYLHVPFSSYGRHSSVL